MKCLTKVRVGLGAALVIMVVIFFIGPAKSYQIGNLIVPSDRTGLPECLRESNWQIIKAEKNELIFKIMTFEPVVRRYEFITHEIIRIAYHPQTEIATSKERVSYPWSKKGSLVNVLGLMFQKFLQEGFEIGKGSSFIKIAGADGYKFELLKPKISTEQWLEGYPPIKYAWHIVVWEKGWYLITYFNFDDAFPGPHFSDFKIFLKGLKFVDQK